MNLVYQVYVGNRCRLYDQCVESVSRYCERHGHEHRVQRRPLLRIVPGPGNQRSKEAVSKLGYLPIMEKQNAFDLLPDYGRVAIIDADVFIRDDAPDIFPELGDAGFAGVRERDMPSTDRHREKVRQYSQAQFRQLSDVEWDWRDGAADFMNMGIMVMGNGFAEHLDGQTAGEFLARPEFQRFIDGVGSFRWSSDQILMNWWIRKTGMKVRHLDWRWNGLYNAVVPDRIHEAWFVHFFLRNYLPTEDVSKLLGKPS